MNIQDFCKNSEQTVKVMLSVDDEDCFIEVFGVRSSKYSDAVSWFKRACGQKVAAGETLITKTEVMGEVVTIKSDTYKKLAAIQVAQIVSSWGFIEELTVESAADLLIRSPSLMDAIDDKITLMAYEDAEAKKQQAKPQKASSS